MNQPEVTYKDITALEGAAERANYDPALRQALLDLGFQSVGILECKSPGAINYEAMKRFVNADDLAMMADAAENGELEEVLTSHDGTIFAALNRFFGGPVVVMRTIFANGVVVETVTRPQRGALPAFAKLPLGSMPLWARQDRPQWGYHVELVDTNQPAALWQRHRQRINELAGALHTSIPPQDNLPLYITLSKRSLEITSYAGRWRTYIANGLIAVFFVLLFAGLFLGKGLITSLTERLGYMGGVSFLLLGAVFGAGLMVPLSFLLPKLLVPRLPGPPIRPVSELV